MKKKLYDFAHCRAGDKGNTSILSLIAYRDEGLCGAVRERHGARGKRHLAHIIKGKVTRHEVPNVGALQFVCEQSLAGGVTTSLAMDAHGKSLSCALLEMEIEI